ncbi:MAG: hypothetical protein HY609_05385 [Deltaproteobacteria bacterium]|nr:hypothetical protein [Deltaproteobacteria bacterium]
MKKACLLIFLLIPGMVSAQMRDRTFATAEPMTAGKLFLDQVDKVSLYLSTDRIVYTPRLEREMQLKVTITLLSTAYRGPTQELRQFVLRHVRTFNKTLTERLKFYTPELAKEFDAERDVSFLIQIGADRQKIAAVESGKWQWLGGSARQAPERRLRVVEQPWPKPEAETSACKKSCPALIKKKPREKTLPL